MIVCICHGVSDRKIKAIAAEENGNVRRVCNRTKAGTDCGSCRQEVHDLCSESRSTPPLWIGTQLPATV